jgi:hypothetical protein
MSTPLFGSITNLGQSAAGAITSAVPSGITSLKQQPITTDPKLSATGSAALQNKSQKQYSNKQFIAPFSYQQNVEGTFINVDYLGKRVVTNGSMPYRAIVSLSAISIPITLIDDPSVHNPDRLVKTPPSSSSSFTGTPTQNAAVQQFGTGINAVTSTLAGRSTQFSQSTQDKTTQLFGSLQNSGAGVLQNLQTSLPFSNINQTVANLPGFNVVTNALGQIPGGTDLTKALSNPVGAIDGLTQTATKGLNLQSALPSGSLGSLGDLFSIASDISHNGPPTSLTGLVSIEKQIKAVVCNFQLPTLTIPDLSTITNVVGGALGALGSAAGAAISNLSGQIQKEISGVSEIGKQIQKEFQDTISNTNNQLDILTQLKAALPDVSGIYNSAIKELTTCDKSPNQQNNVVSGQPAPEPPPAPSLTVDTPILNTGTGFGNAGNATPGMAAFNSTGQGAFNSTNGAGSFTSNGAGAFKSSGSSGGSFGSAGP